MSSGGLYDPAYEHDACGVASSRGSTACRRTRRSSARSPRSPTSSTAARPAPTPRPATAQGSSLQLPDAFFRAAVGEDLPRPGRYGVGVCFLPHDAARRAELERLLETDASRPRGSA